MTLSLTPTSYASRFETATWPMKRTLPATVVQEATLQQLSRYAAPGILQRSGQATRCLHQRLGSHSLFFLWFWHSEAKDTPNYSYPLCSASSRFTTCLLHATSKRECCNKSYLCIPIEIEPTLTFFKFDGVLSDTNVEDGEEAQTSIAVATASAKPYT